MLGLIRLILYLCTMFFSKTFGYAVRATAFVALQSESGARVGLREISEALDIPHHFLGKIMQDLVRHGVLESTKGPHGGFYMNERTPEIKLTEILQITDGTLALETCAIGEKKCNPDRPCLVHNDLAAFKAVMVRSLSTRTIHELTVQLKEG